MGCPRVPSGSYCTDKYIDDKRRYGRRATPSRSFAKSDYSAASSSGLAQAGSVPPQALGRDLRHLFDLVAAGELEVTVGGAFPLERAAEAHRALETRATMGKLLLLA